MDSVALNGFQETIKDPLLQGIDEFVNTIKMEIMAAGASKLNQISKLYKDFNKADA